MLSCIGSSGKLAPLFVYSTQAMRSFMIFKSPLNAPVIENKWSLESEVSRHVNTAKQTINGYNPKD